MNRKISVCIPYYNRNELVKETLAYPLQDDRIDEIIMCDDVSPDEDYHKLLEYTWDLKKIKVIRNVRNWHNQHNKRNAISFAKNEWCVLLDNDNVIDKDFVDKLFEIKQWESECIYHPSWAAPNFDYRKFNGELIVKENVKSFASENIFVTLLNTNNYFVNRDEYLKVYNYDSNVRGSDGIYFAYNWLKAGNVIYIVPNMVYQHRVHPGSEFLREKDSNMQKIYYWLEQVKQLK